METQYAHAFCRQNGGAAAQQASGPPTHLAPSGIHLLAALQWLADVAGEAGVEYAEAVAWCFVGSKTVNIVGGRWRNVMLEKVVRPLGLCCSCVEQTALDAWH